MSVVLTLGGLKPNNFCHHDEIMLEIYYLIVTYHTIPHILDYVSMYR